METCGGPAGCTGDGGVGVGAGPTAVRLFGTVIKARWSRLAGWWRAIPRPPPPTPTVSANRLHANVATTSDLYSAPPRTTSRGLGDRAKRPLVRTRAVLAMATAAIVSLLSISSGAAQPADDFLRTPDFSFGPPAGSRPRSPKRLSSVFFRNVPPGTETCKTDTLFGEPPTREDVMLLSDVTSSMGKSLETVKKELSKLVAARRKVAVHTRFGVASYRDESESSFTLNQPLTPEEAVVQRAIDGLVDIGGGDAPEANLPALHAVATDKRVGWSNGSRRLVIWFGDVPGHEPSCPAPGVRHTRQSVLAALQAARISVIALGVNDGLNNGYDAKKLFGPNAHKRGKFNAYGTCVLSSGDAPIAPGQALFLTKGTSGISKTVRRGVGLEVEAALAAIDNLVVRLTARPVGCKGIFTVRMEPAVPLLKVGEDTTFKTCVTVDKKACADEVARFGFFRCDIRTMGAAVDEDGNQVLGTRRAAIQGVACP
eukprot:TRINITY_DN8725_c0_g1_i1.p1 TRINITY_DN8725_c0_g1~~TRINITY_DN8725_c0_g1_i1.p1  ORF type:complete len:484 (+),score=90.31 TRINITY_DN8725_c0_g1_i1:508-1959(+)